MDYQEVHDTMLREKKAFKNQTGIDANVVIVGMNVYVAILLEKTDLYKNKRYETYQDLQLLLRHEDRNEIRMLYTTRRA